MANEIVKYNNQLNKVAFKNFTSTELKIFFAIVAKLKNQEDRQVVFTFDQLKELTNEKQHYTAKEYADMISDMYHKLIHLSYFYDDGEDKAGEFNLFQGYERSLNQQTFTISVAPKYVFFFNQLSEEFTRFELKEFVNLRGKYPKLLYRLLKQWRMVGKYTISMENFRSLMDIPENYKTKDITRRIVDPSVEKLQEIPSFSTLNYKYVTKRRTVTSVIFTWSPESRTAERIQDHEAPQYAKYIRFTNDDGSEVSEADREKRIQDLIKNKKI